MERDNGWDVLSFSHTNQHLFTKSLLLRYKQNDISVHNHFNLYHSKSKTKQKKSNERANNDSDKLVVLGKTN